MAANAGIMPSNADDILSPPNAGDKRSDFGRDSVGRGSRDSFGRRTVSFNEEDHALPGGRRASADQRPSFHVLLEEHEADMRALVDQLITKHEMELIRHRMDVKMLLDDHLHDIQELVPQGFAPTDSNGLVGLPHNLHGPPATQGSKEGVDENGDKCGPMVPRRPYAGGSARGSGSSVYDARASSRYSSRSGTRRGSALSAGSDLEDGKSSRPMQELFQSMQNTIHAGSVMHYVAVALGMEGLEKSCLRWMMKKRLPGSLHRGAVAVARSSWFELFAALAIVFNSFFIAVTADNFMDRAVDLWQETPGGLTPLSNNLRPQPSFMKVLDLAFACIFTVEWMIRLLSEECGFLVGPDWRWNFVDTIAVLSSWSEIALDAMNNESFVDLSLVRMLRILRVVRSIRIVRVLLVFRELRLLLLSLTGSVMPLLWALVVLSVITFMFGILIQQGVASYLVSGDNVKSSTDELYLIGQVNGFTIEEASDVAVIDMFLNFPRTILTLFKSVSGGENWGLVQFQLESADPLYGFLWCIYIAIMFLGVLNVITGIFVECAVARARTDKEMALLEELERNKERMRQLMELFRDLDTNGDGKVTYDEWESFTTRKEAQAAMALLGLDIRKTKEIYRMLDFNDDQEIDLEEFAVGCMELSGNAKGVDVETLLRNSKKLLANLSRHFYRVENKIEAYMTAQSNKVGMAVDHVERLVNSRTMSENGSNPGSPLLMEDKSADVFDMTLATENAAQNSVVALDNNNNGGTPASKKVQYSRQMIKKRISSLARLAQVHVDSDRVEEVQNALGAVVRTLDSQLNWTTAIGRTLQSELDALSIRYGLYHHEVLPQDEQPNNVKT